ncbi:hypothetical protein OAG62_01260 [bacterium]|nr:hypothetical protein [bacterium]
MSVQTTRSSAPASARSGAPSKGGNAVDPLRLLRQNLTLFIVTGVVGLVLGVLCFVVAAGFFPSFQGVVRYQLLEEIGSADVAIGKETRNEDTVARLAQTAAYNAISEPLLEKVVRDREVQGIAWMDQFKDEAGLVNHTEALRELMDEITASHLKRTQFFEIKWSAGNPDDVMALLNSVTQTYEQSRRNDRESRLRKAIDPYEVSVQQIESDIADLENQIEGDIESSEILTLENDGGSVQEDLVNRELERNMVLTQIEQYSGQQKQLQAKLTGFQDASQDDIREAEMDPVVMKSLQEIQSIRGALAEHRQRFGSDHPQVRNTQGMLDARIREKDRKIDEIINRNLTSTLSGVTNALAQLVNTEKMLDDEIITMRTALVESTGHLSDLAKLEAKLQRKEERKQDIQRQIDDIKAVFLRTDSDIVTLAVPVQRPTEPNFPIWYTMIPGVAFLLVLTVGGVVFVRELLDQRVRTTTDVLGVPGARLLGVIPDLKDDPTDATRAETVVRDHPNSVLAESYRQFAASFRRARLDSDAKSVLFSGGMPDAGTTSVVLNLASTAAAAGRSVAVVDANFRRPKIASMLGLDPNDPGLGDILCEGREIDSVISKTSDGISVIPAGTSTNRVYERFDGEAMSEFLGRMHDRFDVILIDGPPLVVASESMSIANAADASVLVVRAYSEQRGLVARLIRQLNEQSGSFLGVVLNRPRNTAGGYFRRNYEAMAAYSNDDESE